MSLVNEDFYVENTDLQRKISMLSTEDLVGLFLESRPPEGLICMDILHMKDNRNRDVPILRCPAILLEHAFETKQNILKFLLISENETRIPCSKLGEVKIRFRYKLGYPLTFPLMKVTTVPAPKNASRNGFFRIPILHMDLKPCLNPPGLPTSYLNFYGMFMREQLEELAELKQFLSVRLSEIFPSLHGILLGDTWYATYSEILILDQVSFVSPFS